MNIKTIFKNIFYTIMPKRMCINHIYEKKLGKKIRWEEPQTINEKIQWLKLYSDTSMWTKCADKYLVREFVEQRGLKDSLVQLYGVYKSADEIDFSKLPQSFVLKTNNGSGDIIIIRDKNTVNEEDIKKQIQKYLNRNFGRFTTEYHYLEIPPRIICEELLINPTSPNKALIDYKFWCFNGEPYCIFTVANRTKQSYQMYLYDLDWNSIGEGNLIYSKYSNKGEKELPRPKKLKEMIEYAKILSKNIPQVRVDFYEINGKVYFGEMTFTSTGGYIGYFTHELLLKMGQLVKLPPRKK